MVLKTPVKVAGIYQVLIIFIIQNQTHIRLSV